MTILVIINNDKYVDKEYGTIKLRKSQIFSPSDPEREVTTFNLRHNCIILIKSRLIAYEIYAKKQKVFVFAMRVNGPKTEKD